MGICFEHNRDCGSRCAGRWLAETRKPEYGE